MPLLGQNVKVVLMAGGRGERFWPRSTRALPKQFLKVGGENSLLRRTYERALALVDPSSIYAVTGTEYEALTRQELPELPKDNLILESIGRNTAPALALAALWIERASQPSVVIALPSDHHVVGERKFQAALLSAVESAKAGYMVTLGIKPTRPETGYGYIRTGAPVGSFGGMAVCRVAGFTEKPDVETARQYLQCGEYLWNSGMVIAHTSTLQGEVERFLPKVHELLREVSASARDLGELWAKLSERFGELPSISFDYGVLERSDRLVTVPAHFGWNDIGDWAALGRVLPVDEGGNAVRGDTLLHECSNMMVDADSGRLVVAVGAHDLIVVDTPQALLVCAKDQAQEVRSVAGLASALVDAFERTQLPEGTVVQKPWGREIWWAVTEHYAAKIVEVRAGQALSLQYHERKHETLYCQFGTGHLRIGDEEHDVRPGKVFSIPPGTVHRLEATTDLRLIEVSSPDLDDIVRLEDRYGRIDQA